MQNKNHDRRKLMQEIKAKLLLADFDEDCKNLQKSESPDLKDEMRSLGIEVVSVTDEEEAEIFNQADKASASADPRTKKIAKYVIEKNGGYSGEGFTIGILHTPETIFTILQDIVKQKIEKLSGYDNLQDTRLYIIVPHSEIDEILPNFLEFIKTENSRPKKYSAVYFETLHELVKIILPANEITRHELSGSYLENIRNQAEAIFNENIGE